MQHVKEAVGYRSKVQADLDRREKFESPQLGEITMGTSWWRRGPRAALGFFTRNHEVASGVGGKSEVCPRSKGSVSRSRTCSTALDAPLGCVR